MRNYTTFILLIGLLIITLIILLITPENSPIFGIDKGTFASASSLGIIALLVASGISRRDFPFKKIILYSVVWIVIFLVLILGFQYFN